MRFRTQSSADSATRVLFFGGMVAAITGIVLAQDNTVVGGALVVAGFAIAVSSCWMSGPAQPDVPSDERKRGERIENS